MGIRLTTFALCDILFLEESQQSAGKGKGMELQQQWKESYMETGELPSDGKYCIVVSNEDEWNDLAYDINLRRHVRFWYNFLRKRVDVFYENYTVVRASDEQQRKMQAFFESFKLFRARMEVETDDDLGYVISSEYIYSEKDYEEGDVFIFSEAGEILGIARAGGEVIRNRAPAPGNCLYEYGFLPTVICESCGGEKPKNIGYDTLEFSCPICKERKKYP